MRKNIKGFTPLEIGCHRQPSAACGVLSLTGFTLLELLTVIIIVGILGALALPNYMKAQRRSYSAEAWVNCTALLEAAKIYYVDHDYTWTTNIASLPIENPNSQPSRKFDYIVGYTSPSIAIFADGNNITGSGNMMYVLQCYNCMAANEEIWRFECPNGGYAQFGTPGNCVRVGG